MNAAPDPLLREKHAQASALVAASDLDAWLLFVRETGEGADPCLPFLVDGDLTWQSVLLLARDGSRSAVVGSFDADPLLAAGVWDEVIPYVEDMRAPLLDLLRRRVPAAGRTPRIGVNVSKSDVKADGLSHGMYLLLCDYLAGSEYDGSLVSAERLAAALRGRKTAEEVRRMESAVRETEALMELAAVAAADGASEAEIFAAVQREIDARGLDYAWSRSGNPIVNCGPRSTIGHGRPSAALRLGPGEILHIDLGVRVEGYCSDLQRCWVLDNGSGSVPPDLRRALDAVLAAIDAGHAALRPGARGWEVDRAARAALVACGFPEYHHAFGHQAGRMAHDGGTILGPRWPRYGDTPERVVEEGEVYTLELGVVVEGRGYLGLEEMAVVEADGSRLLSRPQRDIPLLIPRR